MPLTVSMFIFLPNKVTAIEHLIWYKYYRELRKKNSILTTCCLYLKGYCLYDFDRQKALRAKYMAKNLLRSWEYEKHDENNMEHRGSMVRKS